MSDYDTVCYMTIPEYYFPLHLPVLIGGGGGFGSNGWKSRGGVWIRRERYHC